jgi:hypothetical protein
MTCSHSNKGDDIQPAQDDLVVVAVECAEKECGIGDSNGRVSKQTAIPPPARFDESLMKEPDLV